MYPFKILDSVNFDNIMYYLQNGICLCENIHYIDLSYANVRNNKAKPRTKEQNSNQKLGKSAHCACIKTRV